MKTNEQKISKVLLINPNGQIYLFPDGRPAHRKHCTPPLGLAYIAASLEKNNYNVSIIDSLAEGYDNEEYLFDSIVYGLSINDIIKRVSSIEPDIIGISALFSSVASVVKMICLELKKAFPHIPIVLGGQHPSGSVDYVMTDKNVDYILCGEGDLNFVSLLNELNGNNNLDNVKSLVYRKDDAVLKSLRKLEPKVKGKEWSYYSANDLGVPLSLDDLPFPAWHLFPMEKYYNSIVRLGSGDVYAKKYGVMVTSRGCPNTCFYCTSPLQSGYKGYRLRSLQSIVDEIHWLVENYQVEEIMFNDDNFFIKKSRVKELLKTLAKEFPTLHFSVPGGTEINKIDEEIIDLLAEANFYKLTLNIESGNEEIQKNLIDKNVKLDRVPTLVKYLRSKNIETRAIFMIGFPGESLESINRTVDMAKNLGADDFMLSIVCPLPGTPLFDECMEKNLCIESFSVDKIRYALSTIKLPDLTPEELEEIRHKVWKEAFEERRKALEEVSDEKFHKFLNVEEYETGGFKNIKRD